MPAKKRKHGAQLPTHDELSGMQETEQLFKSNLFRLQMEELLAEVTPPFGKANSALETALKELKGQLCALPATELSWERTGEGSAEAAVSQPHLSTLRLNNPAVRMPFLPPSKVQLVGSYLLRTSVRPSINIDLAVEIPAKCLHEKDYLDQRYSDKRMLYLAHIGESLRAHHSHIRFGTLSHAPLASWPVLLVPLQSGADVWQVRIVPSIAREAFAGSKLRAGRANLRNSALPSSQYNNLLLLESRYAEGLELLHQTLSRDSSGALREAIMLLKLWLRARTVEQAGCINGFQLSLLMVHLLHARKLTWQMGAYHMFRVALNFLSKISQEPIVLSANEDTADAASIEALQSRFDWVLTDSEGAVNWGANVRAAALDELGRHASASLEALSSGEDSFCDLFTKQQPPLIRFDALLTFELGPPPDSLALLGSEPLCLPLGQVEYSCGAAEVVLKKGLRGRALLVRAWASPLPDWELTSQPPERAHALIGILTHPTESNSLVDKGPSPADEGAVAAWKLLWGEKSETRRFKDGAIVHAVVWEEGVGKHGVVLHAARHLLHRHLGVPPEKVASSNVGFDAALNVPPCSVSSSPSILIVRAFDKLCGLIRKLDGLPLAILSIQAASPSFSFTEEFPSLPAAAGAPPPPGSPPLNFVIQFESSGKWPDDLGAVQALKTAFHLQLASLLESQAKLTCEPTRASLFVHLDGFTFCGGISHEREEALLRAAGRAEEAAALLDATRHAPKHTSLAHTLATSHAAYGPAVRLAKRWLSAQLFSSIVPSQMTELLMAHHFTTPGRPPPASAALGFILFLSLLASFDFFSEPLLLAIPSPMTVEERAEAQSALAKHRAEGGPPIWIGSSSEPSGHPCLPSGPSAPAVRRLRSLAAAAFSRLSSLFSSPSPPPAASQAERMMSIFTPPLHEFDALLHLSRSKTPRPHLHLHPSSKQAATPRRQYANLLLGQLAQANLDPIHSLVASLRAQFGSICLLFYDHNGGPYIAIKWKPACFMPLPLKTGDAQHRTLLKWSAPGKGGETGEGREGAFALPDVACILEEMQAESRGMIKRIELGSHQGSARILAAISVGGSA